jgi:uncharacterized protein (TIGR03083 family)
VTPVDRHRTIDALDAVWSSIEALAVGLDPGSWTTPTALPGWDVQATVAHIVGTEMMLLGEPTPVADVDRGPGSHVRNDIGGFNEVWVQALAHNASDAVLDRFRDVTGRRRVALRAMTQEAWDGESFTPAGRDTYGRFMQIRVFDCWFHEQDIRSALHIPGGAEGVATEVMLDELSTALGYLVGKRAAASTGTTVTIELTGPTPRTFHVAVGERAALVDALEGPATVTLRGPVVAFTRLCGGRADGDPTAVEIVGDQVLGTRIVSNLAYTV